MDLALLSEGYFQIPDGIIQDDNLSPRRPRLSRALQSNPKSMQPAGQDRRCPKTVPVRFLRFLQGIFRIFQVPD